MKVLHYCAYTIIFIYIYIQCMIILRDVHKTAFIVKVQKTSQGWQQTQTFKKILILNYDLQVDSQ